MSAKISLCSPHRLTRNDTFSFYGSFCLTEVSFKQKFSLGRLHRLIGEDVLGTCIKPSFTRMRLILTQKYRDAAEKDMERFNEEMLEYQKTGDCKEFHGKSDSIIIYQSSKGH